MIRVTLLAAALLAPSLASAQAVGDQAQLLRTTRTEQRSAGSMSNSQNSDALVERVVAVTPAGVELEYSLPPGSQSAGWTFPLRVLQPPTGPLQLRNRAELEARIDTWLKDARLTRAACGQWIFTWNAFRIDCDPESALTAVQPFAIGSLKPTEGAPYADPQAARPAPLKARPEGKGFTVELAIDPRIVREELAQADLAVAQINRQKLSLEAARKAHAADQIAGTIKVTIDTDSAGQVRRRTRIATLTLGKGDQAETRTTTEMVERRPIQQRVDPNSI
ncbi:hypothetical protein P6144_11605 [Sphingomonas sp. HITSZ_GF]|uniref:hypothetical protein n=1 Tax=Sphingomonas sp. HITSZ_GF TaxID=3037247 RepID=UPI00240E0271|nr:hypothetical protein [Sphingomonas sp. HITSZ_GF]MDG2534297.1 hypothetical protein [Sphingomonas sp. HITSZ_GF]